MKKRKGFTLVELLAVIAILAILVIMALPAVLRMYRQSRINNFQSEVRSTYRTAQSQFLSDSMLLEVGGKIVYTNGCGSVTGATYVNKLKTLGATSTITGRLLTERESEDMGCDWQEGICDYADEWVYSSSYWIGSAHDRRSIWCVYSSGGIGDNTFNRGVNCGARPVIEVLTSAL